MNVSDAGSLAFVVPGQKNYEVGALTGSRDLDLKGNTLLLGRVDNSEYSGVLGNGTLRLQQNRLTLRNPRALSGVTLDMNAADSGSLIPTSPEPIAIGGLTGARNLVLTNGFQAALEVGGNDLSTTYSGTIFASRLLKTGTGMLTLASGSAVAGTVRIASGHLGLGNVTSLAMAALDMNVSDAGSLAFVVPGRQTYPIASLTGARGIEFADNTLAIASGTVSGVLSGVGGSLIKNGPGVLVLAAPGAFTGTTRVSLGTLQVSHPDSLAGSVLDMNSADAGSMQFSAGTQTYNIGGLAGSRALSLSSGTLAIGGNDLSTTYSGTIFARAFVKSGTGTLTLTSGSALRATTSSATLRIAAGSIAAANENALADVVVDMSVSDTGSISWVIPGTTIARLGGIQGQRSIDCNGLAMIIGNLTSTTFAGSLVNCVAVTKVGTGTLALSGINDFSAGIAINAGSLAAAGPRSIGTAGPITFAGGTLAYASGNTTDYSARFSTSPNQSYRIDTGIQTVRFDTPLTSSGGVLVKAGSGTLILNSSSPLMQATISQGTLQFGPTGAINSGSAAIINNGTLEFNRVEPLVQSGLIGGTGGVSVGSGSVSLKAANSFSGVTRVIGGTLSLDHSHALGLSTLDMAGGDRGTLQAAIQIWRGVAALSEPDGNVLRWRRSRSVCRRGSSPLL